MKYTQPIAHGTFDIETLPIEGGMMFFTSGNDDLFIVGSPKEYPNLFMMAEITRKATTPLLFDVDRHTIFNKINKLGLHQTHAMPLRAYSHKTTNKEKAIVSYHEESIGDAPFTPVNTATPLQGRFVSQSNQWMHIIVRINQETGYVHAYAIHQNKKFIQYAAGSTLESVRKQLALDNKDDVWFQTELIYMQP